MTQQAKFLGQIGKDWVLCKELNRRRQPFWGPRSPVRYLLILQLLSTSSSRFSRLFCGQYITAGRSLPQPLLVTTPTDREAPAVVSPPPLPIAKSPNHQLQNVPVLCLIRHDHHRLPRPRQPAFLLAQRDRRPHLFCRCHYRHPLERCTLLPRVPPRRTRYPRRRSPPRVGIRRLPARHTLLRAHLAHRLRYVARRFSVLRLPSERRRTRADRTDGPRSRRTPWRSTPRRLRRPARLPRHRLHDAVCLLRLPRLGAGLVLRRTPA